MGILRKIQEKYEKFISGKHLFGFTEWYMKTMGEMEEKKKNGS